MNAMYAAFRRIAGVACTLLLGACMSLPPTSESIPVREIRAPSGSSERVVVVLPGRGDDLAMLERSNIAQQIQEKLPDTDVLLVEATLAYYMEGRLVERLHDQVIAPARARYREVWLTGASMGGLGVMMYEHQHPGEVTGLVLMAPFMGPASLQREIRAAGGVASWDPGPRPSALTRENVAREVWRVVRSWIDNPQRARNVWLVCGQEDRLRAAAELVATALPAEQTLLPPGNHRWTVWAPAAAEALATTISMNKRR
jgi:pimeloyl-ACP methyl ester carboxylesterase